MIKIKIKIKRQLPLKPRRERKRRRWWQSQNPDGDGRRRKQKGCGISAREKPSGPPSWLNSLGKPWPLSKKNISKIHHPPPLFLIVISPADLFLPIQRFGKEANLQVRYSPLSLCFVVFSCHCPCLQINVEFSKSFPSFPSFHFHVRHQRIASIPSFSFLFFSFKWSTEKKRKKKKKGYAKVLWTARKWMEKKEKIQSIQIHTWATNQPSLYSNSNSNPCLGFHSFFSSCFSSGFFRTFLRIEKKKRKKEKKQSNQSKQKEKERKERRKKEKKEREERKRIKEKVFHKLTFLVNFSPLPPFLLSSFPLPFFPLFPPISGKNKLIVALGPAVHPILSLRGLSYLQYINPTQPLPCLSPNGPAVRILIPLLYPKIFTRSRYLFFSFLFFSFLFFSFFFLLLSLIEISFPLCSFTSRIKIDEYHEMVESTLSPISRSLGIHDLIGIMAQFSRQTPPSPRIYNLPQILLGNGLSLSLRGTSSHSLQRKLKKNGPCPNPLSWILSNPTPLALKTQKESCPCWNHSPQRPVWQPPEWLTPEGVLKHHSHHISPQELCWPD